METIKNMVLWFSDITAPMRSWKYGEDGKYVHILIGVIAVAFLLAVYFVFDLARANLVGISIYALFVGIAVERIQKMTGGTNTFIHAVFDAIWVWVGGLALSYLAYFLGYVDLYYKV